MLGAEHPATLVSANNLAGYLSGQGKYAEAEQMLHAALASLQRVLGPTHLITLTAARGLEYVPRHAADQFSPPAAAGTARPLPAGTRVLVQRLVAKPEHNGKRARVLSFVARAGRYAVALDDGKELSLKAECLGRAGCAAAGCASEEAGSVCARWEVARYCSRECQRSDWKVHNFEARVHGSACGSELAASSDSWKVGTVRSHPRHGTWQASEHERRPPQPSGSPCGG